MAWILPSRYGTVTWIPEAGLLPSRQLSALLLVILAPLGVARILYSSCLSVSNVSQGYHREANLISQYNFPTKVLLNASVLFAMHVSRHGILPKCNQMGRLKAVKFVVLEIVIFVDEQNHIPYNTEPPLDATLPRPRRSRNVGNFHKSRSFSALVAYSPFTPGLRQLGEREWGSSGCLAFPFLKSYATRRYRMPSYLGVYYDMWDPLESDLRLVRPCYVRLWYPLAMFTGRKTFASVLNRSEHSQTPRRPMKCDGDDERRIGRLSRSLGHHLATPGRFPATDGESRPKIVLEVVVRPCKRGVTVANICSQYSTHCIVGCIKYRKQFLIIPFENVQSVTFEGYQFNMLLFQIEYEIFIV